jgi:hypothetical protein
MKTNDRAARLAELEFIALCKQNQVAKRQAGAVKRRRRMKPDFYSHYLHPIPEPSQTPRAMKSLIRIKRRAGERRR